MSTSFPTGLDSFTNPNAATPMSSATVPHAGQHSDANDAIKALETKVGVNGSTVTTTIDYLVKHPYYGPIPTGTATKDTAAVQAVLNAAATAGTTALLTQPGTFVYDDEIVVKGSVVWGGTTQTHKASATFPTTKPLVRTTPTTVLAFPIWSGSCTFNANRRAKHAVAFVKFTKFLLHGRFTFEGAQQHTVVVGTGTGTHGGFRNEGSLNFTGSAYQAGYASLLVSASDCQIRSPGGHGQETGTWVTGPNCVVEDAHFSNTGILQGYRDTSTGSRFIDCMGDTYGAVTHAASGSSGSSTITDTKIAAIHGGIRVLTASGTATASLGFIPATSGVGAVTTGTSFTLVNLVTGAAVNATGTVTKIKLVATHFNLQGTGGEVSNGTSQSNSAAAKGADWCNVGHAVSVPYRIGPHRLWGKNATNAFANAFVGAYAKNATWTGITQTHVTKTVSPTSTATARTTFVGQVTTVAPSATATTYGTAKNLTPNAGFVGIGLQGFSITSSGVSTETLTVRIQAYNETGGVTAVTINFTTNTTTNSNAANLYGLLANLRYITQLVVSAKSSKASSTAKATVKLFGANVQ